MFDIARSSLETCPAARKEPNRGAAARKGESGCAADPSRRAGDHDDLPRA